MSSPVLKEEYESVHPLAADDPGVVGFLLAVSPLLSAPPLAPLPLAPGLPRLAPLGPPPLGFGIHTQVSCNMESQWQWPLWLKPLYLAKCVQEKLSRSLCLKQKLR